MDDPAEIVIHPDYGSEVDEHHECLLRGDHTYVDSGLVEQSAKLGCPFCMLRHLALKQIWPDSAIAFKVVCHAHDQPWEPVEVRATPVDQKIGFAWENEIEKYTPDAYRFYRMQETDMSLMGRVVPCDTRSEKSLQTTRQWVEECMHATKPTSPRRILDLRHDRVRLVEITGEQNVNRYACLSHCWGNNSEYLLRTKLTNLDCFKREIPFDLLPRTFQDATSFARQLGVMFLWIDSLCIIQDEELDWQQQSAIMADIYQNAYITLAATASDSADQGLYTLDNSLKLHRTDRPPLALVRYRDSTGREVFSRIYFNHNMQEFPLLQRGWVYQERLLSPRVLHFAGDELI
jgi:hypothetical protein